LIVVIKGKSVAGAKRLATHLERADTNERVEIKELRGVAGRDLHDALREMELIASACPNCKKPFYHASINTRADERMTPEQRAQAIDRLEKELGLSGQPRAVVAHEKKDREHCHVVWSRIDLDKMRVISDSHNYRKHELVARELEKEFGHERVQGAHIERDGKPRPERTPSHKEHQQAERTGISPKAARALMTEIWRTTDSGAGFQAALEERDWLLARGDRRDFVGIDPRGGTHSLARRIQGATAKDVRERFADLDPRALASVAEARAAQQERQPAAPERRKEASASREDAAAARMGAATTPPKERDGQQAPRGRTDKGGFGGGAARAAGNTIGRLGDVLLQALLLGETPAPREPSPGHDAAVAREQEASSNHRQKLLRDFDREVPAGTERDAEIERDRKAREGRDSGGRERTRGE
jgi:hypothetical protein